MYRVQNQEEIMPKRYPWEVEAGEYVPGAHKQDIIEGTDEQQRRYECATQKAHLYTAEDLEAQAHTERAIAQHRALQQTVPVDPVTEKAAFDGMLREENTPAGTAPGDVYTGNPKDRIGDTKPQLHLVPPALTIHAALAMKNGADKYGPYNWREKPVRGTVYVSAVLRHLAAWLDGEDDARDSGVHHLGHAAAGLGILLDALETGNLIDDRPTPGPAADLVERHTETAK